MGPGELGVDAEESVTRVDSPESIRCDCCRFPEKSLASAATGFEGGVGVLSLSPTSIVGVVGVRPSTGARRSSSSLSSSSEERPSSWKSTTPPLERTVPMPSVCMRMQDMVSEGRKEKGSRSGAHRGSGNNGRSRSGHDFGINIRKLHKELSVLRPDETELYSDGTLGLCAPERGCEGDVKRLRIAGVTSVAARGMRHIGWTDLDNLPGVLAPPGHVLEPVFEREGGFSEIFFAPGVLIPGDKLDGGEFIG